MARGKFGFPDSPVSAPTTKKGKALKAMKVSSKGKVSKPPKGAK